MLSAYPVSALVCLQSACILPVPDLLSFSFCSTKQQLGYRVDCGTRLTHRVLGFSIRVQSAEYDPTYLQACIDKFLLSFREGLVSCAAFVVHNAESVRPASCRLD